jgi:hypothetical protein
MERQCGQRVVVNVVMAGGQTLRARLRAGSGKLGSGLL